MKNEEQKIPLDREGLRKLGTALLIKKREIHSKYQKRPNKTSEAWKELHQFVKANDANLEKRQVEHLDNALFCIGGPCDETTVKSLGIASFAFEWWHLYENKVLVPYLKERLPGWNAIIPLEKGFDGNKPIVDWKFWGAALSSLELIFLEHAGAIYSEKEVRPRTLHTEEQKIFALTVSDLVNPPELRPLGRKQNSSPNAHHFDALEKTYMELCKDGHSKNGAAREALSRHGLKVVSSQKLKDRKTEFESNSDQSALNSIVADMNKRRNIEQACHLYNSKELGQIQLNSENSIEFTMI